MPRDFLMNVTNAPGRTSFRVVSKPFPKWEDFANRENKKRGSAPIAMPETASANITAAFHVGPLAQG